MENESTNELLKQLLAAVKENTEEVKGLRGALESSLETKQFDLPMEADQAARYLGINVYTVYAWAKEGRLACCRPTDSDRAPLRFLKEDLDDFMRSRRIAALQDYALSWS